VSSAIQTELFAEVPRAPYAYHVQMSALVAAVGDGQPRSLYQIEMALGFKYSQTGLSARIRDLRRGVPGFDSWSSRRVVRGNKNFYEIFRRDA
jgi:hypothetical protein